MIDLSEQETFDSRRDFCEADLEAGGGGIKHAKTGQEVFKL